MNIGTVNFLGTFLEIIDEICELRGCEAVRNDDVVLVSEKQRIDFLIIVCHDWFYMLYHIFTIDDLRSSPV